MKTMQKSLAGWKHLFVSDELFSGIKELQDFYLYALVQSLRRAIAPFLASPETNTMAREYELKGKTQ